MHVPTNQISGIEPFARIYVKSTDCLLFLTRVSTKQVKRVADMDDRSMVNKLADLYRGLAGKLKEIKNKSIPNQTGNRRRHTTCFHPHRGAQLCCYALLLSGRIQQR